MFSSMNNSYYDIFKKLQFDERHDSANERNFLICKSCFWCASFLNRYRIFDSCPTCMDSKLESMPISLNEIYTFDYDPLKGVTLGFWNK